ncbi:NfeD family protein [Pelosinus baikalensis]|uniref:ATP-dependent Clp protease proteolytic subunit n=1 Tax=Pelosinus baikalensis TaxID=2892015 RepID=A0ABS8HT89_9FIRM|nr:NfeD family protein [Pelosinus baikalensis]MCC5466396.1 ATP-dependent Clp protease proteolytic subunit [Pelosinus baikalensis]
MKIILRIVVACIFISMLACVYEPIVANAQQVVLINVKGEIDGSQAALVNRAVLEAEKNNAAAIIIEMDTFGGLVDSAVKIRDMISQTPITTICYIKNRAWSAGALIAIAHKHIAIAPGGSIGAAEPIPTTEKTIAALKAEFAATANKSGRNVKAAEAMVDKTVGFPGYAEPGQILALTDYQAKEVGYAEILAADRKDVLAHYGLTDHEMIEYHLGWPEKIAGWFSDPAVKSFLVSVIFLAVFTEIKTAGMGVAAFIGLLAAMLFFGSQWLTGLAGWFELILFASGILLILIELFVPGFGFWGISGVGCILVSLFLTLGGNVTALSLLSISLFMAIAGFLLILKYLPSSKLWAKLILKDSETKEAGFSSSHDYSVYIGREGVVLTLLRPSGVADFDGVQLDVVSEGQYIEPDVRVKVVSSNGNRIVVKRI